MKNTLNEIEIHSQRNLRKMQIASPYKLVYLYDLKVIISVRYRVRLTKENHMNEMKYEIVKFVDNELELEVSVSPNEETIWLTQNEISELFEKDRKTITRHIQNILKELELDEKHECSKKEHTVLDGKTYIVNIYNLEMIIAIGYRVKSKRAIIFRQWANKVLKEYLFN